MIITLTTDFGLHDPFVGIMKGVILGIAPGAQIVDISHDVQSYDVLEGAFVVETAYRYFPKGTVHVVVVDPGVGSARRPIAASAHGQLFVGPDNGVLSGIVDGEVYHITNRGLFLSSVSRTFHGRDIFSPVAAHLARGASIGSVGPLLPDFVKQPLPQPQVHFGKLLGAILRIDKFGNIITNLRGEDLGGQFTIRVAGLPPITSLYANFSEAAPGEFFAFEGSTGFIELALNQASAADKLKAGRRTEIEVESGWSNH